MTTVAFGHERPAPMQRPRHLSAGTGEVTIGGTFRAAPARAGTTAGWIRVGRLAVAATAEARIEGSFGSSRGRAGSAAGWFRLQRLLLSPDQLGAAGVVTAELLDADGRTTVGVGSRRVTVPVQVARNGGYVDLAVDVAEVDLLGVSVRFAPFRLRIQGSSSTGPTRRR